MALDRIEQSTPAHNMKYWQWFLNHLICDFQGDISLYTRKVWQAKYEINDSRDEQKILP